MMNIWNNFIGIVKSVTYKDVIDVILVAYLVYHAIKLVRESRAIQLVKGLIMLFALYLVASQLPLQTMNFIMRNVLQVGIVALLVVFQPELRRALEQVGRTKIASLNVFGSSLEEAEDIAAKWSRTIDAVCDASESLSRHKIGALMVFERQTRLGEIIGTGTTIDAQASAELLGNVFFPNSPLHDGAMVLRDGKICAAGCFLPLSDNLEISKELGTRHRAALGMSEVSDAIVLVVSEETGIITIAQSGKLYRNFNESTLRDKLKVELIAPKEPSSKKHIFRKGKNKHD